MDAGQTPLDFTYNFSAVLGNAVTKESYIEIVFPVEFSITLNANPTLRNLQFACPDACEQATWSVASAVTKEANWNSGGIAKNVLKITNLFAVYHDEGYQIKFGLSGWSHTIGEQCDSFIITSHWDDKSGNIYMLDIMKSLLLQQSSLRAVDCVVKSVDFLSADTQIIHRLSGGTLPTTNKDTTVLTYYKELSFETLFNSKGNACLSANDLSLYYFSTYAKQADG